MKSAEKKKMGRPLEPNPKNINVTIRLSKIEKDKLDKYCLEKQISISELFRKYLSRLK